MKRLFIILCILSLAAGCGFYSEKKNSSPQHLKIAVLTYDSVLTRESLALFQIKYPDVEMEIMPIDLSGYSKQTQHGQINLKKDLIALLDQGTVDIVLAQDHMYQALSETMPFQPLDDLIKRDEMTEHFPSMLTASIRERSEGKLCGVPTNFQSRVLVYNKQLFQKEGISFPKEGITWEEVFDLAVRVKKVEGQDQNYGLAVDLHQLLYLYTDSLSLRDISPDGTRMSVNALQWKEAWTTVSELGKKGALKTDRHKIELNYNSNLSASRIGQSLSQQAMFFANFIEVRQLWQDGDKIDSWGIIEMPSHPYNKSVSSDKTIEIAAINSKSKNQGLAWEFLKFVTSSEKDILDSNENYGRLPITNKGLHRIGKDIGAFYKHKPVLNLKQDLITKYSISSSFKGYKLSDLRVKILNEIIAGAKNIEQGLEEYEARGNEILSLKNE